MEETWEKEGGHVIPIRHDDGNDDDDSNNDKIATFEYLLYAKYFAENFTYIMSLNL